MHGRKVPGVFLVQPLAQSAGARRLLQEILFYFVFRLKERKLVSMDKYRGGQKTRPIFLVSVPARLFV